MSLALCDCGALIDTDDGDAYFQYDEDGNEIWSDEPLCSSCRDGSY